MAASRGISSARIRTENTKGSYDSCVRRVSTNTLDTQRCTLACAIARGPLCFASKAAT